MNARIKSITESFFEYFDICYAAEDYQREHVGRIRYSVYCKEFGYEDTDNFPDGIERDCFDQHSVHCLVTHKSSNIPAGCVRLVLTKDNENLPFEKFCPESLDQKFFDSNPVPRDKICEISRLAVDRRFRRRAGEDETRYGGLHNSEVSQQEQRTFPLIAVSCYLAATSVGELSGCTGAVAMMEPFLPRLLRRSGVNVSKVGSDIDYHGVRAPYFMTLEDTLNNMLPELRELYDKVHEIIVKDYKQL